MKILHIIPSLNKGGAERIVLDICNELQNRNHVEVKLITFSSKNEYPFLTKTLNWQIIPSHFTPSITKKASINIDVLQKEINDFQPDVIHSHLFETEMVLSQIKYSCSYFVHFHDNMSQLNKVLIPRSKKEITDKFEKNLLFKNYKKKKTNFICISNHTLKYAKKVLPNNLLNNINLLPNAIDFRKFENTFLRTKDKIRLLNIGSFVSKKNQKLAIDIVKKLHSKSFKAELTFLGDGPLKNDLIEYTKQLNLSDYIYFEGNVENVTDYLQHSNIYLHTATYEPFGLVLLEAMAAGLPVVSLDGGGNKDIINNGINGYILKEQDVEEFSDIIINLSKNEILYNKIALKGQATAKAHDIKNYVDNLLEIYNN